MKSLCLDAILLGLYILYILENAQAGITHRSKRAVPYCTYQYQSTCQRQVPCTNNFFFPGCVEWRTVDCVIDYQDCCAGDVMDGGICYGPDEPCDDCYTLTDCNGRTTRLTSRYGSVISPGYPTQYPDNEYCDWTIRGPRNSTITIYSMDISMQEKITINCNWDWSRSETVCTRSCPDGIILSGTGVPPSEELCGTISNFPHYYTNGRTATVTFFSDRTISGRGFRLVYFISGGVDPAPQVISTTDTTTPPTTTATLATTTTSTTTATLTTKITTLVMPSPEVTETTTPFLEEITTTKKRPKCPGRLQWNECPKCTRTCNNFRESEEECRIRFSETSPGLINSECRPGCECPTDYPIWHNLECVNQRACVDEGTQKCPEEETWYDCKPCEQTCESQSTACDSAIVSCQPGCGCPEDRPIKKEGKCIARSACSGRTTTQRDECIRFGRVSGKCARTCYNSHLTLEECATETFEKRTAIIINNIACICPEGQISHDGICRPQSDCPGIRNQRCGPEKVWLSCKPSCEPSCKSPNPSCMVGHEACTGGCGCPPTKPVFHDGKCIAPSSCPIDQNIVCGKQFYEPNLRILGGSTAMRGTWPWMVQIEKKLRDEFSLVCGGTVICTRWVLTAAHCFLSQSKIWTETSNRDLEKYRLHIGKHFKKYHNDDVNRGMLANIRPKRVIVHENYDKSSHINDIALIELPNDLQLNRIIRPACVYNITDDYHPLAHTGETCVSAGWGEESNADNPPEPTHVQVLKQVELQPRSPIMCLDLFKDFNIETMHCVGGRKDHDTCGGDSGGPLMCKRGNRWYVDGVVSFGLKCGVENQPGVYTRVPRYSSWIHSYTGKDCGSPDTIYKSEP